MTVYSFPTPIATHSRRLTGCGTRHSSPAWTASARAVRAALVSARQHAPHKQAPSADFVAERAIDLAAELGARDRAVLAVVLGDLARLSRRDANDRHQLDPFVSR